MLPAEEAIPVSQVGRLGDTDWQRIRVRPCERGMLAAEFAARRVRLFSGLPALFVDVRCSLEVLEAREAARKDRTLGQARAQYGLVHAQRQAIGHNHLSQLTIRSLNLRLVHQDIVNSRTRNPTFSDSSS